MMRSKLEIKKMEMNFEYTVCYKKAPGTAEHSLNQLCVRSREKLIQGDMTKSFPAVFILKEVYRSHKYCNNKRKSNFTGMQNSHKKFQIWIGNWLYADQPQH